MAPLLSYFTLVSRTQCSAKRCTAEPGPIIRTGPRVCGASLRAAPRPGQGSIMVLEALGELVNVFRRPARHFHAEVQAHLRQHFLDLVQRLAAEVRGAEHFGLR